MKVVCKSNGPWKNSLTIGKEYKVQDEIEDCYLIKDNTGAVYNYYKERFDVI